MEAKIVIAKPCHENWNKMSPEEQGRHCAVCSKVVKDFTKMQTSDIVNTLKNTEGEVCGRINVKDLTPANKKQKVYFWINGVLFRKAIYPIMALLGVSLLAKKAQAQVTHDYPVKGKMAVRDYHTNAKKITIVVRSKDESKPIANAGIIIISGIKGHAENLTTDANGRVTVEVEASDIISNEVEIEISALGYEYKRMRIKVVKDIQTIEIRMEDEMMMMGEMMYIPEKSMEQTKTERLDSIKKIEVVKCSILNIQQLPEVKVDLHVVEVIEPITHTDPVETTDEVKVVASADGHNKPTGFNLFPNPSTEHVNIVSLNSELFNVDIYDGNGKKIHTIINSSGRYTLDVSNYATGVYYALIMVDGKAVETKKIIVSR